VGDAARPRHLARRGLAIPGQRPPSRSPPRASSVAPPSAAPPASSRGRPTDTAASEGREGRLHVLQVLAPKTHHDVAVQEELLVDIKVRFFFPLLALQSSPTPLQNYMSKITNLEPHSCKGICRTFCPTSRTLIPVDEDGGRIMFPSQHTYVVVACLLLVHSTYVHTASRKIIPLNVLFCSRTSTSRTKF
jgi:hypothetical protein